MVNNRLCYDDLLQESEIQKVGICPSPPRELKIPILSGGEKKRGGGIWEGVTTAKLISRSIPNPKLI
ncbi:MAG: hypothetical protein H8E82_02105 [Candidatus Marinimicrobia bacterium]|nr:hypothetical protein [Candidatus Neomarinimicrobiota bacterium]